MYSAICYAALSAIIILAVARHYTGACKLNSFSIRTIINVAPVIASAIEKPCCPILHINIGSA